MKKHMYWLGILTLLASGLLFTTGTARADIMMKQKNKTDAYQMMGQQVPAKEFIQVTWMGKDSIRHDMDSQSNIVRLDKMVMYMLDHNTKTYREIPLGESSVTDDAGEDKEEAKQRKRAMGMMTREMMKMQTSVSETNERKKINDWNCRKYIQQTNTMMGVVDAEVWASEDIKMDYDLMARFSAAMSTMHGGAIGGSMDEAVKEMKKIKGVAVLTTTTMNMMGAKVKSSMELLEIKEGTAPVGSFDPPVGYRKRAM